MKLSTLYSIAEKENYIVEYKRYSYWDSVLYFNNTAICLNVHYAGNTQTIRTDPEYFPAFVTRKYIKEAVENNYECLGLIKEKNRDKFGGRVNYTFPMMLGCY